VFVGFEDIESLIDGLGVCRLHRSCASDSTGQAKQHNCDRGRSEVPLDGHYAAQYE
jgi:hypothetical protein